MKRLNEQLQIQNIHLVDFPQELEGRLCLLISILNSERHTINTHKDIVVVVIEFCEHAYKHIFKTIFRTLHVDPKSNRNLK